MSNTIDKLIIITFSIVTNPYPCHLYMFITENYSSKFLITSFWAPVLKSPAENGRKPHLTIQLPCFPTENISLTDEELHTTVKRVIPQVNHKSTSSYGFSKTYPTKSYNIEPHLRYPSPLSC